MEQTATATGATSLDATTAGPSSPAAHLQHKEEEPQRHQSANGNDEEKGEGEEKAVTPLPSDSDYVDMKFVQRWLDDYQAAGGSPFLVLQRLMDYFVVRHDTALANPWALVYQLFAFLLSRTIPAPMQFSSAMSLIKDASNILIVCGAGISTSSGIPDFRSEKTGLYATLKHDYPTLPQPEAMFDMHYFLFNPFPFFKFAKVLYPGNFAPTPSHQLIRKLQDEGKLLRCYTQNIDSLEELAGVTQMLQCHGSFSRATCIICGFSVPGSAIKDDVFAGRVPLCPKCPHPDEPLDEIVSKCMASRDAYMRGGFYDSDTEGESDNDGNMHDGQQSNGTGTEAEAGEGGKEGDDAQHDDGDGEPSRKKPHMQQPSATESASPNLGGEGTSNSEADGPADQQKEEAVLEDCPPFQPDLTSLPLHVLENKSFRHPLIRTTRNLMTMRVPVMKPNIVFFHEDLPPQFYDSIQPDVQAADLVLVMGSSLQVGPVNMIPSFASCPKVFVNREPIFTQTFTAELLGNCDDIAFEIAAHLGLTLDVQPTGNSNTNTSSNTNTNINTNTNSDGSLPPAMAIQEQATPAIGQSQSRQNRCDGSSADGKGYDGSEGVTGGEQAQAVEGDASESAQEEKARRKRLQKEFLAPYQAMAEDGCLPIQGATCRIKAMYPNRFIVSEVSTKHAVKATLRDFLPVAFLRSQAAREAMLVESKSLTDEAVSTMFLREESSDDDVDDDDNDVEDNGDGGDGEGYGRGSKTSAETDDGQQATGRTAGEQGSQSEDGNAQPPCVKSSKGDDV